MLLYAVVEQYTDDEDWEYRIRNLTVRGLFTDKNAAYQHLEDGINDNNEELELVYQEDGYRRYQERYGEGIVVRYVSEVTTDTMDKDGCGLFPWLFT